MSDTLSGNTISSAQIYDGGSLNQINAEDLKGNLVAIKQLINQYNEKSIQLERTEQELNNTRGELEFQNTYQYVVIVSAVFNVVGTIMVGIGVNQITGQNDLATKSSYAVLIGGGVVILVANIATICYRWVRKWFNRKNT